MSVLLTASKYLACAVIVLMSLMDAGVLRSF
jgi:hypothetical protein